MDQPQGAPFKESLFRAAPVRLSEEETRKGEACMLRAQGDSWVGIFWGKERQVCKADPWKKEWKCPVVAQTWRNKSILIRNKGEKEKQMQTQLIFSLRPCFPLVPWNPAKHVLVLKNVHLFIMKLKVLAVPPCLIFFLWSFSENTECSELSKGVPQFFCNEWYTTESHLVPLLWHYFYCCILIKVALFACRITFGTDDVSGWKMFWNIQPDLQIKGCWSRFINDVCFLMFSTRIGTMPCLGMARDGNNNFEVHAVRWEKKWDRNYWWQPWLMMWIAFKIFMKNMRSFYTKKVIV